MVIVEKLDIIKDTKLNCYSVVVQFTVGEYLNMVKLASYQDDDIEGYFKSGKDLFSSQPACVGFVTAIALTILGRPGNEYTAEKQNQKWQEIKINADRLLQKLSNLNNQQIGEFLDFFTYIKSPTIDL
ncbi:hypothetical protein IQ226_17575 [Dolichospermum sp. LEGE 00240]|jgi:hypothetical protein|uniref:hypothetical protein n=1 Tax=Aphanizomenonaceae TaxID=1892259 RepID=UPI0018811D96|nr:MULTISPECIES: hypothetical protein [Aphanizomenonaceae]MDM3848296.1 hypothetical protein [Aphanizomenon gracile PMC638.10]MDM3849862.1 hypothetical protein [Aphanizomenon gracile PMC627.10]MDM3855420.1 hypothetical protein [Aphanizomenon gracile PMC649.10]MBE9250907.1 hypothetical protein [Dolichospermum sp. LEGE 00240]MDB9307777.1 hypothetical protein [Aphanizomenon sp. CS-733/32]